MGPSLKILISPPLQSRLKAERVRLHRGHQPERVITVPVRISMMKRTMSAEIVLVRETRWLQAAGQLFS